MNPHRLDITSNAKRQLKSIYSERKRAEIVEAILDLREKPLPPNRELQRELAGGFRLKIDGWRILYKIDETHRVVTVLVIRPRTSSTYLNVP